MKFRTVAAINDSFDGIDHSTQIMLLGSCFANGISQRLRQRLFDVCSNPFGTIYNPASINRTINRIVEKHHFTSEDIFQSGSLYHSFDCHSSLSDADQSKMLARLNRLVDQSHQFLSRAGTIFLTFGTAWVYELADNGEIVANCHKQPADRFVRRLMSVDECEQHIIASILQLQATSGNVQICLTVSPIRHLADGLHGNQISKATLLLAIDRVVNAFDSVKYFPAYEMIVDDLRDYRFYAADMCHPSEMATDYVFERLSETFFSQPTQQLAQQCQKIVQRLMHRPLTSDKASYQLFIDQTNQLLKQLVDQHPCLKSTVDQIIYSPS